MHAGNGIDQAKLTGNRPGPHTQAAAEGYGTTPGNLGNLPAGAIAAVVSSPPYEGNPHAGETHQRDFNYTGTHNYTGNRCSVARYDAPDSRGQLGTTQGTTFWEAAAEILRATVSVLAPGAHCIWVAKRYVRDGQIVDFTADWIRLCESVGLRLLHHHRAMLVEDHGTQTDLFQGDVQQQTIKASFFRRLHMKKRPDLAILWEDVTCWIWDGNESTGAGVACCVSSPPFLDNGVNDARFGGGLKDKSLIQQSKIGGGGSTYYGTSPSQLACLPPGDLASVIKEGAAVSLRPSSAVEAGATPARLHGDSLLAP